MNTRESWSRFPIMVGSLAMVAGAIDPLEGSLLILPGSALVALGTYFSSAQRRLLAYRLSAFVLILIGVAALWGFSFVGGVGGGTGRSGAWSLLMLVPCLVGWILIIAGPGSPRWLLWLGFGIGLYYVSLMLSFVVRFGETDWWLAAVGVPIIGSCVYRLSRRTSA